MSYATRIACYEAAIGTILISIKPIARNYDTNEAAIGPIYASEEPFAISKQHFFAKKNAIRMQYFEQDP